MPASAWKKNPIRSEEHTSELQSHSHLVCRFLLEEFFSTHAFSISMLTSLRLRTCGYCCCINATPASHFFFFNDTATTEIYTLSLHDALPIFFCNDTATTEIYTFSLHDVFR